MKLNKTIAALATALVLAVSAMPFGAFAAGNDYKVTIRIGNYGTIGNASFATVDVVNATADLSGITIHTEDSRVATAIYCANQDAVNGTDSTVNLTYNASTGALSNKLTNVTSDRMYVVVYDYLSNLVPYTIQYVDAATGLQIAPSSIAYGAAGATITAGAAPAVSNYTYSANSGNIVLSASGSNNVNTANGALGANVITYSYTLQNSVVTTVNTETETTENVTVIGAAAVPAGGAGAAAGGAAGGTTTITDNTTPQGGNAASSGASSEAASSSETTIEDEQTPEGAAAQAGLSLTMKIVVAVAVIAGLALIIGVVVLKKRGKSAE